MEYQITVNEIFIGVVYASDMIINKRSELIGGLEGYHISFVNENNDMLACFICDDVSYSELNKRNTSDKYYVDVYLVKR